MPSLFPERPRVVYEKSPLLQVIAQARFPTILRIDSESPAAFQERVRHDYPKFSATQRALLPTFAILQQVQGGPTKLPNEFSFESDDESWKVVINQDFLSLQTTNYNRWEEFETRLGSLMSALVEIYRPAYFSRLGLRYVDVIARELLGLSGTHWRDLVAPQVLGELGNSELEGRTEEAGRQLRIKDLDNVGVLLQHGLAFTENAKPGENGYVIDIDVYESGQISNDGALAKFRHFNSTAGRAFRWCITDKLHDALVPRSIV